MSKKKLSTLFAASLLCLTIVGGSIPVGAATVDVAVEPTVAVSPQSEEGIMPYSDIIEWRYKVINGKLYKRQYNCTDECWVGSWQLVPNQA